MLADDAGCPRTVKVASLDARLSVVFVLVTMLETSELHAKAWAGGAAAAASDGAGKKKRITEATSTDEEEGEEEDEEVEEEEEEEGDEESDEESSDETEESEEAKEESSSEESRIEEEEEEEKQPLSKAEQGSARQRSSASAPATPSSAAGFSMLESGLPVGHSVRRSVYNSAAPPAAYLSLLQADSREAASSTTAAELRSAALSLSAAAALLQGDSKRTLLASSSSAAAAEPPSSLPTAAAATSKHSPLTTVLAPSAGGAAAGALPSSPSLLQPQGLSPSACRDAVVHLLGLWQEVVAAGAVGAGGEANMLQRLALLARCLLLILERRQLLQLQGKQEQSVLAADSAAAEAVSEGSCRGLSAEDLQARCSKGQAALQTAAADTSSTLRALKALPLQGEAGSPSSPSSTALVPLLTLSLEATALKRFPWFTAGAEEAAAPVVKRAASLLDSCLSDLRLLLLPSLQTCWELASAADAVTSMGQQLASVGAGGKAGVGSAAAGAPLSSAKAASSVLLSAVAWRSSLLDSGEGGAGTSSVSQRMLGKLAKSNAFALLLLPSNKKTAGGAGEDSPAAAAAAGVGTGSYPAPGQQLSGSKRGREEGQLEKQGELHQGWHTGAAPTGGGYSSDPRSRKQKRKEWFREQAQAQQSAQLQAEAEAAAAERAEREFGSLQALKKQQQLLQKCSRAFLKDMQQMQGWLLRALQACADRAREVAAGPAGRQGGSSSAVSSAAAEALALRGGSSRALTAEEESAAAEASVLAGLLQSAEALLLRSSLYSQLLLPSVMAKRSRAADVAAAAAAEAVGGAAASLPSAPVSAKKKGLASTPLPSASSSAVREAAGAVGKEAAAAAAEATAEELEEEATAAVSLGTSILEALDELYKAAGARSATKAAVAQFFCRLMGRGGGLLHSSSPVRALQGWLLQQVQGQPGHSAALAFHMKQQEQAAAFQDSWLRSFPRLLWSLEASQPACSMAILRLLLELAREAPSASEEQLRLREVARHMAPYLLAVKAGPGAGAGAAGAEQALFGPFNKLPSQQQLLFLHFLQQSGTLTPALQRGLAAVALLPAPPAGGGRGAEGAGGLDPAVRAEAISCAVRLLLGDAEAPQMEAEGGSSSAAAAGAATVVPFSLSVALGRSFSASSERGQESNLSLSGLLLPLSAAAALAAGADVDVTEEPSPSLAPPTLTAALLALPASSEQSSLLQGGYEQALLCCLQALAASSIDAHSVRAAAAASLPQLLRQLLPAGTLVSSAGAVGAAGALHLSGSSSWRPGPLDAPCLAFLAVLLEGGRALPPAASFKAALLWVQQQVATEKAGAVLERLLQLASAASLK